MFSELIHGLINFTTSPEVVFVIVGGNLPLSQKDCLLNRREMTWETFESISHHELLSDNPLMTLTGPHVLVVPFETERVPLLVEVCPSLFSISPCEV